jgi:NADH-quinone oxidoreductase subunit A
VVVAATLDSWLPFLIYGSLALIIPASMIVMSFVFAQRPARRVKARVIPFESGVSTGPPQQQRFTVSFYLTAMLFIVFDIEIVFLYPLAVILDQLAWFGLFEFLFFIGILVVAYVYVWRKGALDWQ